MQVRWGTWALTEPSREELPALLHPLFSTRLCIWQPSIPKPRCLHSPQAPLARLLQFQLVPLRYEFFKFFYLPRSPHQQYSGYLFMYLIVFFVSSSVWFCFPARSSGELRVWLKCVDWCCCGATPFSSSPLLISSIVAAACETRSTRILCLKVSHILVRWIQTFFYFFFSESPAMMTSIMYQYWGKIFDWMILYSVYYIEGHLKRLVFPTAMLFIRKLWVKIMYYQVF